MAVNTTSQGMSGQPALEVRLRCERSSAYHVRESLKRGLAIAD